jgi:hypothetical protein
MAKNRNKKEKISVISMDTTDIIVSEAPQEWRTQSISFLNCREVANVNYTLCTN